MDYIEWRGDLSLEQIPFGDVDYLIMCRLSYIEFADVVSGNFDKEPVRLRDAVERAAYLIEEDEGRSINRAEDEQLLKSLAESRRYEEILLHGYVDIYEEESQEQFCAMTLLLPDGTVLVVYRGTDKTLVGWKEDFNMIFCENVPSQRDAVYYLNEAVKRFLGKIRITGHSKGGNLAMYAAAFCEEAVQERILEIRNLDGPGFNEQLVNAPQFQRIKDRMRTYIPQSSVVGMLMEHAAEFSIVKSDSIGIFQHDLYSWVTTRDGFVLMEKLTNSSIFIDRTIKNWLAAMSREQREKFIDGIYSVLGASDSKTLRELWNGKNTLAILKAVGTMDVETRDNISEGIKMLKKSMKESIEFKKHINPAFESAPYR
jgi:hypothetical protein